LQDDRQGEGGDPCQACGLTWLYTNHQHARPIFPPPHQKPTPPHPTPPHPTPPHPQTIDQTVQKNLRQLRADCDAVLARLAEAEATDAANKASNAARTLRGLALSAAALAAALAFFLLLAVRAAGLLCGGGRGGGAAGGAACDAAGVQRLAVRDELVEPLFAPLAAAVAALALLLAAASRFVWRHAPTLTKRDLRRAEEFREATRGLQRGCEGLYEAYFNTISHGER
jgi:hypothetical protein